MQMEMRKYEQEINDLREKEKTLSEYVQCLVMEKVALEKQLVQCSNQSQIEPDQPVALEDAPQTPSTIHHNGNSVPHSHHYPHHPHHPMHNHNPSYSHASTLMHDDWDTLPLYENNNNNNNNEAGTTHSNAGFILHDYSTAEHERNLLAELKGLSSSMANLGPMHGVSDDAENEEEDRRAHTSGPDGIDITLVSTRILSKHVLVSSQQNGQRDSEEDGDNNNNNNNNNNGNTYPGAQEVQGVQGQVVTEKKIEESQINNNNNNDNNNNNIITKE
ncbi:hypothetical protein RFI_27010 [Reticulomyxa filosa]|uniref:Uncharacterized protein n=1 Tax=Reticulomyxa filosa TaxID=46433 RepID=X6M926_RETFI|nr:hypothetical protein RFI_27010 [Reticulomyxa filosa]|eukprot:ETO10364.1 hypothetical protein RFI_27010 [Reticulomyxa filosa]